MAQSTSTTVVPLPPLNLATCLRRIVALDLRRDR
jgi:hypothetical protein